MFGTPGFLHKTACELRFESVLIPARPRAAVHRRVSPGAGGDAAGCLRLGVWAVPVGS